MSVISNQQVVQATLKSNKSTFLSSGLSFPALIALVQGVDIEAELFLAQ